METSVIRSEREEIVKTIARQIGHQELRMAGFRFVALGLDGEGFPGLRVNRRNKNFDILYCEGQDVYHVHKHTTNNKTFETTTEINAMVMCEDLQPLLEAFFRFKFAFPNRWD